MSETRKNIIKIIIVVIVGWILLCLVNKLIS